MKQTLENKDNTYAPSVNGESIYILMSRKGRRYIAWEKPAKAERRKHWEAVRFSSKEEARRAEDAYPKFSI